MADRSGRCDGFTLVEVAIALFLLAVGVIATAPLFVYAAKENAVGSDLGSVGALAVRQMEVLRGTDYTGLSNGGDLESNIAGYFDASTSGYIVRWTIVDNPNPPSPAKLVTVRALALRKVVGERKDATLIAIRGE